MSRKFGGFITDMIGGAKTELSHYQNFQKGWRGHFRFGWRGYNRTGMRGHNRLELRGQNRTELSGGAKTDVFHGTLSFLNFYQIIELRG